MTRKPYTTDLTDEQWALLAPLLPAAKPGGRPRSVDLREIGNGLLYVSSAIISHHERQNSDSRAIAS